MVDKPPLAWFGWCSASQLDDLEQMHERAVLDIESSRQCGLLAASAMQASAVRSQVLMLGGIRHALPAQRHGDALESQRPPPRESAMGDSALDCRSTSS
eukprot:CAMPEP_0181254368 /NCGR_PEP_ID=MMETSP1096-20121128/48567_1 /TAXON_ID=156174 ORGANISM="Chrysochromulina ericina, Strain CCMP281" /NCGR_SAMPLE_ID=MMETSP1096 /ASSEMBLY_ACC=CAM_ASM_000453 /LENGTH=98 /DNA_ID=CAMNT_0023352401 /DNA_START=725 /DNA_END=1019 /DNA_ORIENTATION=+